jgi:hypothetical protein
LYDWYFDPSPVAQGWLLGCALLSLYSLDQPTRDLFAAGHPHRSWQKQVRAHRGKRALTPTTHHAHATGETAYVHQDRSHLLVLLARLVRTWQQALIIVQPETLLRWHRELFRLYWKRKSKTHTHQPKVAVETIALIREMARNNRLWGAERIRGELLKLVLTPV